jgi:hypothetical protein
MFGSHITRRYYPAKHSDENEGAQDKQAMATDDVPQGDLGVLVTIRGDKIVGMYERLTGTKDVSGASRESGGSINIFYKNQGGAKLSRKVFMDRGNTTFVTENGDLVEACDVKIVPATPNETVERQLPA